ncbi:alpha/beta hydrolase [Mitsuaria sp. CC2]|uniref:alpha/beta fold hydrolase n=1 Tax=Mitsuaria sp. CC2 TaxID=3029186 RepID=UPI003B8B82E7
MSAPSSTAGSVGASAFAADFTVEPHPADALFPASTRRLSVETEPGVRIHARVCGEGPPLLLIHGHPQTLVIWHRVLPELAARFTVVMPDLRGYGDSSKPKGDQDHGNYSKRRMAQDLIAVMGALGHARFRVLAHDRGARVAHRMAADHPTAVERLALLDIAPTLAMYEQTTEAFARAYWHWFFLIQPEPMPERLIEADPAAYALDVMGRRHAGLSAFDPRAFAEYQRALALPGTAHGMCEDYRAAAGVDLAHDRADRDVGAKLAMPLRVYWGAQGVVAKCFEPLKEWQRVAADVDGGPLPCGHYIPEEAPDELLAAVMPFLIEGL